MLFFGVLPEFSLSLDHGTYHVSRYAVYRPHRASRRAAHLVRSQALPIADSLRSAFITSIVVLLDAPDYLWCARLGQFFAFHNLSGVD